MPTYSFQSTQGPIGYLLRQAQHALRVAIDRTLAKYDITHPQFVVLCLLEEVPHAHSADIARLSLLSPQAVNVIVQNLEKRKLIQRKAHKEHGRILVLSLTALGKKRIGHCKNKVAKLKQKICEPLSKAEEQVVRKWLVHCANTFNE